MEWTPCASNGCGICIMTRFEWVPYLRSGHMTFLLGMYPILPRQRWSRSAAWTTEGVVLDDREDAVLNDQADPTAEVMEQMTAIWLWDLECLCVEQCRVGQGSLRTPGESKTNRWGQSIHISLEFGLSVFVKEGWTNSYCSVYVRVIWSSFVTPAGVEGDIRRTCRYYTPRRHFIREAMELWRSCESEAFPVPTTRCGQT